MLSTTIAGALVAGLAIAAPGPAPLPALTAGDGLAAIQQRADQAIDQRIASIGNALASLGNAEALTDAHRSRITDTLNADKDGLAALKTEIDAETSAQQALADYQRIFTDYRVYAVAIPQALYVAAADRLTEDAIPHLQQASDTLSGLVGDNETAKQDLDEANAAMQTAVNDTDGLADAILAVTPDAYDADHTAIADLRQRLANALIATRSAVEHGRAAAKALR